MPASRALLRFLLAEAARKAGSARHRSGTARKHDRPRRDRDGQAWRVRAELLERRRSRRLLRRGPVPLHDARRQAHRRCRSGEAAGAVARGNDGRRLCVPGRFAPASRRGRDANRHLHRSGRALLREHGAELGARGVDQGAPMRGRHCGGQTIPQRTWSPSSGASISTSPPSKTSTRSSAKSTPMPGTRESRCTDTISSSGAAGFGRSSSLPRRSN